jgi:hypothetical protein
MSQGALTAYSWVRMGFFVSRGGRRADSAAGGERTGASRRLRLWNIRRGNQEAILGLGGAEAQSKGDNKGGPSPAHFQGPSWNTLFLFYKKKQFVFLPRWSRVIFSHVSSVAPNTIRQVSLYNKDKVSKRREKGVTMYRCSSRVLDSCQSIKLCIFILYMSWFLGLTYEKNHSISPKK